MALKDAFERLASIAPGLEELRRYVEADPGQWLTPRLHEMAELLGPDSRTQNELARTRLALLVAMAYLRILSGDKRRGDLDTPYFVVCERPMVSVVRGWRKSGA